MTTDAEPASEAEALWSPLPAIPGEGTRAAPPRARHRSIYRPGMALSAGITPPTSRRIEWCAVDPPPAHRNDPFVPDEARPTRLAVPLDLARDHTLGDVSAPVRLLEYGDYECPDCRRAYPMLAELQRRFGPRLLFAFRHFPVLTLHTHASVAAQAAEAAGQQGKFWAMHDLLYLNQDRLETPDLTHYAAKLGLEIYKFESSLTDGVYRKRVETDYDSGVKSGVRGTPTLFINDVRYDGAIEVDAIADAIERASS